MDGWMQTMGQFVVGLLKLKWHFQWWQWMFLRSEDELRGRKRLHTCTAIDRHLANTMESGLVDAEWDGACHHQSASTPREAAFNNGDRRPPPLPLLTTLSFAINCCCPF